MGLYRAAKGGSTARSFSTVSLLMRAMVSLDFSVASAAMMPEPPALVTMARFGPAGSGWVEKAWANSNSEATSVTRMTPVFLKAAE